MRVQPAEAVHLADLVAKLGGSVLPPSVGRGPALSGVKLDSRSVEPGDLYCALVGTQLDGTRYVHDAVKRGAAAILAPRELDVVLRTPTWIHPQARGAAGRAAALVYGEPARGMDLVGITGTNGKTTVAHLVGHLLATAGRRPAVLGTAGNRLADGVLLQATHTTPDAPALQRLLRRHVELGGDSVAMEVSSHALEQERVAGLSFKAAIYTNLTRDHLDYHGDFEGYARAKQKLFEGLDPDGCAIVNGNDPHHERMAQAARARGAAVATYGVGSGHGLCASQLRSDLRGTHLVLSGMGISRTRLWLPLAGRYNVENALAAAAAALVTGASPSTVLEGLATASSAPGRLEPVPVDGRGFTVLVDYAHTEDALENVLSTLRSALDEAASGDDSPTVSAPPGRLIVVFGCGGDRDRGKRAPMGRVVDELADLAIVTSDNPRSEDPERILAEILEGMSGARARREVQVDRRAAIAMAIEEARRGDVVLIAGKGHESTQTIGSTVHAFDDRKVALEVLSMAVQA
jgi:UDP-N-acetylmuramoyl-L-alanyl-D-glutamate--2,6-diaminopimelate ligase